MSKVLKQRMEIMNLTDTINYQKDAVVSKQLLKKETGTVTTFAFDKGQGLSEHTAPFDAMVVILDGEAEIIISSKVNIVKSGEMIIMPANEPHALKAKVPFKMLLIMIKSQ
ncbi:MAG: cupin domain-containing protein [Candidatus Omnitrophica bacterium]|nr:cupin domain-containing protein [Candidatus Omnitrophota bacterium]MBU1997607.1 cupin domain-containing protein [Candidatus Omnitrophota bacterium]MBU4333855.1 cupin domain-containing protein [Candidatus Omnitrophota bacterium]